MTTYLKRPRLARDPHGLTYNERRVVELLLEGLRPLEIAGVLGTSHGSAKTLAINSYRKLGVRNQVQLMARMRPCVEAAE